MALTGSATLFVVALLTVAVPVTCLLVWNRLGRRAWLRASVQALLLVTSQALAVLLVAVLVNNYYGFYTSWSEVFGHAGLTSTASPVVSHRVDKTLAGTLRRAFHGAHGTVIPWVIPGPTSHIPPQRAFIYLPAAYGNPTPPGTLFPVVELLDGVPAGPESWTGSLKVKSILDARIASGESEPFIAVMPTQNVELPRDTQCVDVVGGPKVDTYLTRDVRKSVLTGFRATPNPAGWATMGYSTGGYCAVNLAMRHPDMFAAAVSLSGYAQPATDPSVGNLFGGSVVLRDRNTPLWEAAHWGGQRLSLMVITSHRDGPSYRDTVKLQAAVHPPLQISSIVLPVGGHNQGLWIAMEPVAFNWLSQHLLPPLADLVIHGPYLGVHPALVINYCSAAKLRWPCSAKHRHHACAKCVARPLPPKSPTSAPSSSAMTTKRA